MDQTAISRCLAHLSSSTSTDENRPLLSALRSRALRDSQRSFVDRVLDGLARIAMIPLRKLQRGDQEHEESHDPFLPSRSEDLYSNADSDEWNLDDADFQDEHVHQVVAAAQKAAEDPFLPFEDLPDENRNILTIRAILVGSLCGGLVNASSIYLGLKSGWTDSANIFGSIVGFAVLKACEKYCGGVPILGGDFGARENNIVQTVATAAGGMSNVFVSAFPAMYQLGLMKTPIQDFWRITTLTAVGGYFGLFFATPLRNFFIIQTARELNLIFPSSYACATTIRSMHLAVNGAALAQKKMRALSIGFIYAVIARVVSQYAVGIFWDWHPFTWLYLLTGSTNALAIESWGWLIQWTPAFIGTGMLVGMNVALSFVGGSVLAWGIIGPGLVRSGTCFGQPATETPGWDGLMDYFSLSDEFTSSDHPSPRYWLLWPGVACMIAVSFTELACQWRVFYLSGRTLWKGIKRTMGKDNAYKPALDMSGDELEDEGTTLIKDTAHPSELVKIWMWLPGLAFVLFMACFVMRVQYDMPIAEVLLALFLAFFFSFLAIQSSGATDITPLTAASKASQIILGSTTSGQGWTIPQAQRLNLLGGALASIGANQASDLTGDFRVGFLLRTSPLLQWLAQSIGTLLATFIAPGVFVLFATAYPCILEVSPEKCPFGAPSVSAWRAVAIAVTDPHFSIPRSSKVFAAVFAVFGSIMVLIRQLLWTGKLSYMRAYHPSMMIISLAFLIPQSVYGIAMLIGAVIAAVWHKYSSGSFELLGYAVAAGLMAGEGIGGVINAVLTIVGVDGERFGVNWLCPGNQC